MINTILRNGIDTKFKTQEPLQECINSGVKKYLNHKSGDITDVYIGGSVEIIRPVLEAISRGYLSYFDADLAREIYEPDDSLEIEVQRSEPRNNHSASNWLTGLLCVCEQLCKLGFCKGTWVLIWRHLCFTS